MSEVFRWDGFKGTLLDYYGNAITNNAVTFTRTEKGEAGRFNGSTAYLNIDSVLPSLATTTTGTFIAWCDTTNSATTQELVDFADTDADTRIQFGIVRIGGLDLLRGLIGEAGVTKWALDTDDTAFVSEKWVHVALVQDGVSPVLYVNGTAVAQAFSTSTDTTYWFNNLGGVDNGRIGCGNWNNLGNHTFLGGDMNRVRIYDTALTVADILVDYNEFLAVKQTDVDVRNFLNTGLASARQVILKEDFRNYGADAVAKTMPNWEVITGTFGTGEVTTDTSGINKVGDKYLTCLSVVATVARIAIPCNQAYGTWETDLYKATDTNSVWFTPISSHKNTFTGNTDGYELGFNSLESFGMTRYTYGGADLGLTNTAGSYIANGTWYRIKLTRSPAGEFTYYIKGGAYGTSSWTLVTVTTGTNPFTENTYTTSNWMVIDMDVGDRVGNLVVYNGVI